MSGIMKEMESNYNFDEFEALAAYASDISYSSDEDESSLEIDVGDSKHYTAEAKTKVDSSSNDETQQMNDNDEMRHLEVLSLGSFQCSNKRTSSNDTISSLGESNYSRLESDTNIMKMIEMLQNSRNESPQVMKVPPTFPIPTEQDNAEGMGQFLPSKMDTRGVQYRDVLTFSGKDHSVWGPVSDTLERTFAEDPVTFFSSTADWNVTENEDIAFVDFSDMVVRQKKSNNIFRPKRHCVDDCETKATCSTAQSTTPTSTSATTLSSPVRVPDPRRRRNTTFSESIRSIHARIEKSLNRDIAKGKKLVLNGYDTDDTQADPSKKKKKKKRFNFRRKNKLIRSDELCLDSWNRKIVTAETEKNEMEPAEVKTEDNIYIQPPSIVDLPLKQEGPNQGKPHIFVDRAVKDHEIDFVISEINEDVDMILKEYLSQSIQSEANINKVALRMTGEKIKSTLESISEYAVDKKQRNDCESDMPLFSVSPPLCINTAMSKDKPLQIDNRGFIFNYKSPKKAVAPSSCTDSRSPPSFIWFNEGSTPKRKETPTGDYLKNHINGTLAVTPVTCKETLKCVTRLEEMFDKVDEGNRRITPVKSPFGKVDKIENSAQRRIDFLRQKVITKLNTVEEGTGSLENKLDFVETEIMKQIDRLRNRVIDSSLCRDDESK